MALMRRVIPIVIAGLSAATALAGQGTGCPPPGRIEPDFGLTGIECVDCTLHSREPAWIEFAAPPKVRGVRPDGPAAGRLRDGDVVVSIDGLALTTTAGARRFASPPLGRPVSLGVRRGGRLLTVTIVPEARCADEPPPSPQPSTVPTPAAASDARGWFGVALQCGSCGLSEQLDGRYVWWFDSLPTVIAVDPGGPAARAGVRAGDTLVAIDGVSVLTEEGGRRFGLATPGAQVRLELRRRGETRAVLVTVTRRREPS
jgi:regulator of sigma E protease